MRKEEKYIKPISRRLFGNWLLNVFKTEDMKQFIQFHTFPMQTKEFALTYDLPLEIAQIIVQYCQIKLH